MGGWVQCVACRRRSIQATPPSAGRVSRHVADSCADVASQVRRRSLHWCQSHRPPRRGEWRPGRRDRRVSQLPRMAVPPRAVHGTARRGGTGGPRTTHDGTIAGRATAWSRTGSCGRPMIRAPLPSSQLRRRAACRSASPRRQPEERHTVPGPPRSAFPAVRGGWLRPRRRDVFRA
jgi:hypothetical protein